MATKAILQLWMMDVVVVFLRNRTNMIWIHTNSYAADVMQMMARWYRTD
jgi:hypothetical protein